MLNILILTLISNSFNSIDPSLNSFIEYTNKYHKNYSNTEFTYRFNIFQYNVKYINQHNDKNLSYLMGINNFTDWSKDEFSSSFLNLKLRAGSKSNFNLTNSTIPSNIDWRSEGLVTNVKNQQQCGSCWAFSAVGTLEGQHAKKTKNLVSLSEQNLVDCATDYNCDGCGGGFPDDALVYVKDNKGIDTEDSYPYNASDNQCSYNKTHSGATVKSVVKLPNGSMPAFYHALGTIGPLSVAIDAEDDFQFYKNGIFNSTTCSKEFLDHAVLAVGYGISPDNHKYIIVKNSWGSDWGMDGYIYFSGDVDNLCGIASYVSYPIV